MKKLWESKRKILRSILMFLGAGSVSLLFQACYGMPMDVIEGNVQSNSYIQIPGLKVTLENNYEDEYAYTGGKGQFKITTFSTQDKYTLLVEDIDGPANGSYKTQRKTVNRGKPDKASMSAVTSVTIIMEEDI